MNPTERLNGGMGNHGNGVESQARRRSGPGGRWRWAVAATAALAVAACTGTEEPTASVGTIDAGTVAVGSLPEPITGITDPPAPPTVPLEDLDLGDAPVADSVRNNRLLMIGDFVLEVANTNDLACSSVNPQGWTIELDAVGKATIDLGREVVEARLNAGDFDVVGLVFGNNVDTDVDTFKQKYEALIDLIGGRPVLVYTPVHSEASVPIAETIRGIAKERTNVRTVDWGYATAERPTELLTEPGFPTPEGASELWTLTNIALGEYAEPESAECLPAAYTSASYTGSALIG